MSPDPRKVKKKRPIAMSQPFRLSVVVLAAGLLVTIDASEKAKDDLYGRWAQAKEMVSAGELVSAEVWDDHKKERLAAVPPDEQPANKKKTTNTKKRSTKKDVVQQDNHRRKPGKRPRA
jgi:hypothetical protein